MNDDERYQIEKWQRFAIGGGRFGNVIIKHVIFPVSSIFSIL